MKIAIIGAGLSGLSAAHLLGTGAEVTLFDKARGPSGRMSTRRADQFHFDHGAQYFTARSSAFQSFIQPYLEQGIIQPWTARYAQFDGTSLIAQQIWGARSDRKNSEAEPRYVGAPAMNAFGKALATGLNIKSGHRIAKIERDSSWTLTDEEGLQFGGFDWVISTAPPEQTVQLLPENVSFLGAVEPVEMLPCFAVMLGLSSPFPAEFDAAHVSNSPISWLARNSSKPDRLAGETLIIHSAPEFSKEHVDLDREQVMEQLIAEAEKLTQLDVATIEHKAIHRWLYANVTQRTPLPTLIDHDMQIGVCGDWCHGGRVEGAFLSAHGLVDAINGTAK